MKISRAMAAIVFFAAVSASSVFAQPKPAGTPLLTAPTQSANLPEAKIALVDTDEFLNEKNGIVRLVAAAKKVEGGISTSTNGAADHTGSRSTR